MASVESIRRQLDVIEGMPVPMRTRYLKAIQAAINAMDPSMCRNGRRELHEDADAVV